MNGWTGKILCVNLDNRSSHALHPSEEIYHNYLGGKGLAGHYLAEEITRSCDDPKMPLFFFAGPLVGTKAPTSGRMTVMTRSPLTGTVGDTSVGGKFGTEMKRAGLDGIIVTGKSENLVGIEIEDDRIEFQSAESLKGLTVSESMARLPKGSAAAVTGPAAENGVKFACIMFDGGYSAGRGGLGLSFAKKNLKYVAIKGSGKVSVSDPELLKKAREEIFRLAAASPVLFGEYGISNLGTPALYDLTHTRRMMPTDNFKKTFFEPAPKLNAQAMAKEYEPKRTGCKGCHILCKKKSKSGDHLPEFETLSHFTALVGNTDLESVLKANKLCNELGMDTISAAATVACHQEISGIKLTAIELVKLVEDIGFGKGIGKELSEGSRRYAIKNNREDLSISVKGLELPGYDPRGAYGMALAYATSTRGACHLRAYPIGHEILRRPVATDRFSFDQKARIIKISEEVNAVIDSLVACKFIFFGCSLEEYASAMTAVTGVEYSANQLSLIGERIYYQERIMNAQVGFCDEHDDLPTRFFTEPGTSGPGFEVPPIDRDKFIKMRQKYYRIRGLDEKGMPTKERAEKLGLRWKD